jgi:hypothetical protein
MKICNLKVGMVTGFAITASATAVIIMFRSDIVIYGCSMFIMFGIGIGFNCAFYGNYELFPTEFIGAAYAICNTVGRLVAIGGP